MQPDTHEVDQSDRYAMDLTKPITTRGADQDVEPVGLEGESPLPLNQAIDATDQPEQNGSADGADDPGQRWHQRMAEAQGDKAED